MHTYTLSEHGQLYMRRSLWIMYSHRCLCAQPRRKKRLWLCNRRGTLLWGVLLQ